MIHDSIEGVIARAEAVLVNARNGKEPEHWNVSIRKDDLQMLLDEIKLVHSVLEDEKALLS